MSHALARGPARAPEPPAVELAADRRVRSGMEQAATARESRVEFPRPSPWRVRPSLLYALALSLLLHAVWSLWPVATPETPEDVVLTATLEEMPPPPAPAAAPSPPPKIERSVASRPKARRRTEPRAMTAPDSAVAIDEPASAVEAPPAVTNSPAGATHDAVATPQTAPAALEEPGTPPVVLPPRLDLAYKVFLGTQGFMIGDATYRFERSGDRYHISTVGQTRGLAALILRGRGKVESRGRITTTGLKPYEFAIERGSEDRREVAFFDWDAGNVVLQDGGTAQLEAPAFDPLTILWQPYFSPPSRDDQTFSLATTRKVARYTLSLQAEETIAWPRGEVLTQRWHRVSDDGRTEAWFWLAPSMHYIPVKMRVTRTARGTLEVVLDSIRTDDASVAGEAAPEETAQPKPWNPMEPVPGPDAHGQ